jgi:hypothetical protein
MPWPIKPRRADAHRKKLRGLLAPNATPMDPAGYVPGLGHLTDRIFKCGECGQILIKPE